MILVEYDRSSDKNNINGAFEMIVERSIEMHALMAVNKNG
jgi:hypothetical protein